MKGKEFVKLLEQNGWVINRIHGSHHIMKKNGKTVSVPVHSNDIGSGLLNKLMGQTGLK